MYPLRPLATVIGDGTLRRGRPQRDRSSADRSATTCFWNDVEQRAAGVYVDEVTSSKPINRLKRY
jgi:hypothetical protein